MKQSDLLLVVLLAVVLMSANNANASEPPAPEPQIPDGTPAPQGDGWWTGVVVIGDAVWGAVAPWIPAPGSGGGGSQSSQEEGWMWGQS